eukprot:7388113-Prymnesium_polylepis.1
MPSARKVDVSIAMKPQPSRAAIALTTVVLAVPGGPKRMAEYDAAASSAEYEGAAHRAAAGQGRAPPPRVSLPRRPCPGEATAAVG